MTVSTILAAVSALTRSRGDTADESTDTTADGATSDVSPSDDDVSDDDACTCECTRDADDATVDRTGSGSTFGGPATWNEAASRPSGPSTPQDAYTGVLRSVQRGLQEHGVGGQVTTAHVTGAYDHVTIELEVTVPVERSDPIGVARHTVNDEDTVTMTTPTCAPSRGSFRRVPNPAFSDDE